MFADCNRDRRRRDSSVKYHQRSCSRTEDMEELPEYNENDNARCGIGGDDNAPHPRHRRQQHSLICPGLDDSSMTMMPPESSVSTHGQGKKRYHKGWTGKEPPGGRLRRLVLSSNEWMDPKVEFVGARLYLADYKYLWTIPLCR